MALKKCVKCAEKIQLEASSCRFCGAEQPPVEKPKVSGCAAAVGVLSVILTIGFCTSQLSKTDSDKKGASLATSASPTDVPASGAATAVAADEPKSAWFYSKSTDAVRGKNTYEAKAISSNEVQFDFPYAGGSSLSVTIRKNARSGTNAYFTISKGQMLCSSYDGCHATIKFDNKPPKKFSLDEPADHSIETVFVENEAPFVKQILTAKKMVVELQFYQGGLQQFQFDVSGLHWPPREADY